MNRNRLMFSVASTLDMMFLIGFCALTIYGAAYILPTGLAYVAIHYADNVVLSVIAPICLIVNVIFGFLFVAQGICKGILERVVKAK